jgi:EAL domain-containing protein (putative c-di-GMP-specific phosphodiesterase class I)
MRQGERLEIEVTESVLAENNRRMLETLNALRAQGIRIVLDDFGTGYASLGYLRQFSFDKIKIDKLFVHCLPTNQGAEVILEAIVGMSLKLGLTVVGEGVETRQQLMVLRRLGCTEVQGYLLGRPIPEEGMAKFLSGNVRHLGRARRMGVRGVELAS